MKTPRFPLVACLVGLGLTTAAHGQAPLPPTHFVAGPAEIVGYADLNGNGRADAVVVDRATGAIRVGYQQANGTFQWADSRPGGVYDVTGVAAGRFLGATQDLLAITSDLANRIQLLELPTSTSLSAPISLFPAVLGPATLAAGQLAGTSAPEDLVVGSARNPGPFVHRLDLLASDGAGGFTFQANQETTDREIFGAVRVLLKTGATHQVAYGLRTPAATGVRVLAMNQAGTPQILAVDGLPANAGMLITPLAGSLAHVISWVPGEEPFEVRDIVEDPPGTFTATAPVAVTHPFPIGRMIAVPADNAARLLILSHDGQRASLHDTPTSAGSQTFEAPASAAFTGVAAVPGADGAFQLLYGSSANSRSTGARLQRFDPGSGTYALAAEVGLPSIHDLSGAGHVLVYAGEPFVAPTATVLQRWRARDWSSQAGLPGGNVQVTAETDGGAGVGLGSPAVLAFGSAPAAATHVLSSQYADPISIFSLRPAEGTATGSITPNPAPGRYDQAVPVTLTGPPGANIRYRIRSSDPWSPYTAPIWLHQDTLLEAFGTGPGPHSTPILAAAYQFRLPAGQLSSLDDGIPDYVKIGLGFDPFQLPDRSADNNHDETLNYLQLIVEGHGVPRRHTSGSALDLHVRPWSHDGLAAADIPSRVAGTLLPNGDLNPGNRITVHDVSGEPLDTGLASHWGHFGAGQTAAWLREVGRGGRANVVVASSAPSFALDFDPPYDAGSPFLGRELAGLVILPAAAPPGLVHPHGGGTDAVEAAAWKAAAIAHYAVAFPPALGATIDPLETMVLLVFEQWVTERFVARGLLPASYLPTQGALNPNRLTLTAFRPSEPARPIPPTGPVTGLVLPTPEQLAQLEQYRDSLDTGHLLAQTVEILGERLRNSADPDVAAVRAVTLDVYRISTRWAGSLPGAFPSPLEALREFLGSGLMPRAFRNDWEDGLPPAFGGSLTPLGPADYSAALAGLAELLQIPVPRPVVTRDLRVLPDSAGLDCTLLERVGPGHLVALLDPAGRPFRFPDSFELVPGLLVRVLGFADPPPNPCAPEVLEVVLLGDELQALVTHVPLPPLNDADGNLLDDDWELLFLGQTGNDPFTELTEGYTLLQSFLDGTDPWLPASYQSLPPAALELPAVQIEPLSHSAVQLLWSFPPAYAPFIDFKLQAAPALGEPWSDLPVTVEYLGNGLFQIVADAALETDSAFWRLTLGLK